MDIRQRFKDGVKMEKDNRQKPGYGKILDAWVPPEEAGDPIGVVATSFTFDPVFFEEECLGRFLKLETDAEEDGPLYLIEREEKLAGVSCASALVDERYCRGPRSMRWDLLSARVPSGILHAKITLLHWASLVRLIVASANMTEDGYRRNQEVYGLVDYKPNGTAPLTCLHDIVIFLREAALYSETGTTEASPAIARWNSFLYRVMRVTDSWRIKDSLQQRREVKVHAVLSGADRSSVVGRLRDLWPGNGEPERAVITSPFFDPPEVSNKPAKEMWNLLKKRGETSITYNVTAEDVPGSSSLFLHAPEALLKAEPKGRSGVSTFFSRVQERVQESDSIEYRPLHLKSVWLENDGWAGCMVGSSNFTSEGMGLSAHKNIEANLLYLVNAGQNRSGLKLMRNCCLEGENIDLDLELKWDPKKGDEDASKENIIVLPAGFRQAVYGREHGKGAYIQFIFGDKLPTDWLIRPDGESEIYYDAAAWITAGTKEQVRLAWPDDKSPPSGFEVNWKDSETSAWWAVNLVDASALPPPEELKNLPLDLLIAVLTSARPLCQVLRSWLKRKNKNGEGPDQPILDPLKRVDSSGFLLQRTRKISWALSGLRERLQRPVATREAMEWRLTGPVGVIAFTDAMIKDLNDSGDKTYLNEEVEKTFLIAELILELDRVRPKAAPGCLHPGEVTKEIRKTIQELRSKITTESLESIPAMKSYVERVLKETAG